MVHQFKLFDTNIVVDSNSLKVHVVDNLAFSIISMFTQQTQEQIIAALKEDYPVSEIVEVLSEIDQLKENGDLFSEEPEMDLDNLVHRSPEIKALCLHVAHDCNIRCQYCFASCGDYNIKRGLMSLETGRKALDFVIRSSGKRKNIEVDFFGGEPLLNFDVVKEIVAYGRDLEKKWNKKFRFTITTNAMLLDQDKMDYINQEMDNIVLSIDGRQEINDKMRKRIDGSGTYAQIVPKIQEMVKSRHFDKYYVRGTFTRNNIDFAEDVLHLADLGFDQISVEPVVANKDSGFDIRKEDLPLLFTQYELLAKKYLERQESDKDFTFFHFMLDLEGGPCAAKRIYGCGAGFDYVAVTPEGEIYPCHQFVGMEDFKLGDVDIRVTQKDIPKKFMANHIYSKEECKNCWAKFFCSGGCTANAYQFSGKLDKPYDIACELLKKRVECALWIKTQMD